jgi:malate dehydrogenase (oxaloacetate-decarboxylating)(NADP+)
MFVAVAGKLASLATDRDLELGTILPPIASIREVSAKVAVTVKDVAQGDGLATEIIPSDPGRFVRDAMYQPVYSNYLEQVTPAG